MSPEKFRDLRETGARGPFLERPGNLSGSKSNSFNFDPLALKNCSINMFQT